MTEPGLSNPEDVILPLRDRIPEYLTVFGLGWLGVAVLGLAIGAFSDASAPEGVAYVAMGYGVVLLLVFPSGVWSMKSRFGQSKPWLVAPTQNSS